MNSAAYKAAQSASHSDTLVHFLPFYSIPSKTLAGFLRGNLNKFCLGFELRLRHITSNNVPRAETISALVFLEGIRYSVLAKDICQSSVLYKDSWLRKTLDTESEVDDDTSFLAISEGMGVKKAMKKYGYSWWEPKFDWSTWVLKAEHAKHFLVEQSQFSRRFQKRAIQVSHVDVSFQLAGYINEWLDRENLGSAEQGCIFEFCIGLVMIQWRIEIWAQIINTNHADPTAKDVLLSGRVAVSDNNVRQYVTNDPYNLLSSNRAFYKDDPMTLLEYFFGLVTPYTFQQGGKEQRKLRNNWERRPFRLLFKQIYESIIRRYPPSTVEQWKTQLYQIIHATNPLLPVPDGTQLIQRGKNSKDKATGQVIQRGYCWSGWDFPAGLGPLGRPVTSKEILQYTYPSGSKPSSKPMAQYTNKEGRCPYTGAPPQLSWEVEYLGIEPERVKQKMDLKLNRLH